MTVVNPAMKDREGRAPPSPAESCGKKAGLVLLHSQVLRIKEEDSHLGQDHNKFVKSGGGENWKPLPPVDVVVLSAAAARPVLPCSPLSGKTAAVKALN